MINDKQHELVVQVVGQIDKIFGGDRGLPETGLHSWTERLIKLCHDFASAAQAGPLTRADNGWPIDLPDSPKEEDIGSEGRLRPPTPAP